MKPGMVRCVVSMVFGVLLLGGCTVPSVSSRSSSYESPRYAASYPTPNFDGPVVRANPTTRTAQVSRPAPTIPAVNSDDWVPTSWHPAVKARPWKYIVIHHSATSTGGAHAFDQMHRKKGWDQLGYHFVIGNGTDTGDGTIETGSRWPIQKHGAHAKTPDNRFNDYGIGICLVGNFDHSHPSDRQLRAVVKLTAYLMRTYNIPAKNVIGHCDVGATHCPGEHFDLGRLRAWATKEYQRQEAAARAASSR